MKIKKSVKNFILKALSEKQKDLNYFKKELISILKKQYDDLDKKDLKKDKSLEKSLMWLAGDVFIEKGRAANIGEVREWKGRKFKKIAPNKWRPIYESNTRGAKQSIKILAKKVSKAQSVDELLEIVMQNVNRFTDENGKTLDIVKELQDAVNEAKGRLNAGKPTTQQQIDDFNKKNSILSEDERKTLMSGVYGAKVKEILTSKSDDDLKEIWKESINSKNPFFEKLVYNEIQRRNKEKEKPKLNETKIRENFNNPEKLGKWNGKIYGNQKYGYSIYVDNKRIEINNEEKKQLEDYAAKKAEDSKKAMKEKRNTTIRNDIVKFFLRKIGARERDIEELDRAISTFKKKNLPEKIIVNFLTDKMEDARTERYNSSDLIQSDYQTYIDNMSEDELKTLSDIAKNELEKIKTQKQKELDEKNAKEKADKEYKNKLLTDENFRKEEEDKKRAEREKQRKQELRVEEIAGEGYWNGKVYGSARNGYSVYVANKKYTIPEKDYELFDLKKSFSERIKEIITPILEQIET